MARFVFACDSFKGTLSSARTAELLTQAAERYFPGCECVAVTMADGGEGTVGAVTAATGGETVEATVADPLGEPVAAAYGMLPDGSAVIEMAAASGLPLVAGREDVLAASTYGTGQLVADALDRGAKRIAMALGGSATNDGGMGALAALGARFYDGNGDGVAPSGAALARVARVDLTGLDPRLAATELVVMCDVDNPLTGEHGATRVFGPQKGATPELVELLEEGMASYGAALSEAWGNDVVAVPGAGAAGGLGAACLAMGAKLQPGITTVLDLVGFDKLLTNADLVVTGEGRLDGQTARGKVVAGVAAACKAAGVPCVAVAGSVDEGAAGAIDGLAAAVSCVTRLEPLDHVLAHAEENFADAADRLFSLLSLGGGLV